jgi:hypothetical protein
MGQQDKAHQDRQQSVVGEAVEAVVRQEDQVATEVQVLSFCLYLRLILPHFLAV